MLTRIRRALKDREEGFTLIELLVVMIIIGILAAIAIPVFLSQRAKAQDSAAKADVSTIGKELASYFVDGTAAPASLDITNKRYTLTPPGVGATAQDIGKASTNVGFKGTTATTQVVTYATTGMTQNAWCVSVVNPQGSQKSYKYSSTGGLDTGDCSSPTAP